MSNIIQPLAAAAVFAAWLVMQTPAATPPADKVQSTLEQEDLDVRYARTWLKLTEARLKQVRDGNRRVAGAYPAAVVAEYERLVDSAKTQLDDTDAQRRVNEFAAFVRDAEAAVKNAETEWAQANAINHRRPGSFAKVAMEILKLRAELARLLLERGRAAAAEPREDQIQWQLAQLRHEVLRLREEVAKNQSGRYIRRYRYID